MVVSMPVQNGMASLRVRMAMTISSSARVACLPRPFTAHSTCRAPAPTPASEFGDGEPEIIVAAVENTALSEFGTRSMTARISAGKLVRRGVPMVSEMLDGGGAGLDRGLDASTQEIDLGAGCVHRRPFHIVGVGAGVGHRGGDAGQHLGLVDAI